MLLRGVCEHVKKILDDSEPHSSFVFEISNEISKHKTIFSSYSNCVFHPWTWKMLNM
jgi:hypothetical protein